MSEQVNLQSDLLILPGDPEFYETLGRSLPVGYEQERDRLNGDVCCVASFEDGGTLRTVSLKEATEYAYGGELDAMEEYNEIMEQEFYVNAPEWML